MTDPQESPLPANFRRVGNHLARLLAVRVFDCAVLVIGLLISPFASSDIQLFKLIGDQMILQRDAPIKRWGKAAAGETISITFRGKHLTTRADKDRHWSVTVGPFSAGGPYETPPRS